MGLTAATAVTRDARVTTDPREQAAMSLILRAVPSPIRAVPGAAGDFAWTAAFTALVSEAAGVGGYVYAVQAVLLETGNGPKGTTDRQVSLVDVDLTRAALPGRSSLAVPITVHYTLPGGEREAFVDVAAIVVGQDGYYYQTTRRFQVA
jgi:hypothetical protein